MMKQVMAKAWELAKQGAAKFGGSSKEYLASSLQIAWKEQKEMAKEKEVQEVVLADFVRIGVRFEILGDLNGRSDKFYGRANGVIFSTRVGKKETEEGIVPVWLVDNKEVIKIMSKATGGKFKEDSTGFTLMHESAEDPYKQLHKAQVAHENKKFEALSDDDFVCIYKSGSYLSAKELGKSDALSYIIRGLEENRYGIVELLIKAATKRECNDYSGDWYYYIKKSDLSILKEFVDGKNKEASDVETTKIAKEVANVKLAAKIAGGAENLPTQKEVDAYYTQLNNTLNEGGDGYLRRDKVSREYYDLIMKKYGE